MAASRSDRTATEQVKPRPRARSSYVREHELAIAQRQETSQCREDLIRMDSVDEDQDPHWAVYRILSRPRQRKLTAISQPAASKVSGATTAPSRMKSQAET